MYFNNSFRTPGTTFFPIRPNPQMMALTSDLHSWRKSFMQPDYLVFLFLSKKICRTFIKVVHQGLEMHVFGEQKNSCSSKLCIIRLVVCTVGTLSTIFGTWKKWYYVKFVLVGSTQQFPLVQILLHSQFQKTPLVLILYLQQ